jgi:hypothetical protein
MIISNIFLGSVWLLSWDKKNKDNKNKNIFDWRDKDINVKINISLEQF